MSRCECRATCRAKDAAALMGRCTCFVRFTFSGMRVSSAALAGQFAANELVHGLSVYASAGELRHDDFHDAPEIFG